MTPDPPTLRLIEYERQAGVALSAEQARRLRENFAKAVTVTRAFDGPGYDLAAAGIVGVIVLPDLIIRIDPKVPVDNLFFMLSWAYGLPSPFRKETTSLDPGDSLLEFVAGIFVGQVDALVRAGIARGYVDRQEEHHFLRGRLLVGEQARRSVVAVTRFHQSANEFTADLPENRILRATLALLLRHYYRKAGLRVLLRRALSAFSEVTPVAARPSDCDRIIYTRLNRRYEPSIRLARLLLQLLSPERQAGPTPFPAFLLPMHDVFEKFVANFLIDALAGRPGWRVAAQPRIYLDRDRLEPGDPDLVLYRDGAPALVIDTKYKAYGDKPTPADRNQMFAYCRALGVGEGLLLYPNDADIADHRRLIGGGGEHDAVRLTLQPVSLAGSLGTFQKRWEEWARGMEPVMMGA